MQMSNIVSLANKRLEGRLKTMLGVLDSVYQHVNEGYAQVAAMEKQCDLIQAAYDELLKEFIDQVGPNNVPVEYLNYSNNLQVELVNGQVVLKWKSE